jgi:magnesium transporter
LFEPDPDELADVQDRFGLHDLAVEDAQTFHLRPKVEQYEEGHILFAVIRTASYFDEKEDVEFGEVSIFLSRRFLITVRHGVASELGSARRRLESRPELLKVGPAAGLWAILDKIVDDYAPVIAGLENDVEQVEGTVFRGTSWSLRRCDPCSRNSPSSRPPRSPERSLPGGMRETPGPGPGRPGSGRPRGLPGVR